jgi:hypothetical protein
MRTWRQLPILVRFLIGHGAIGFGLSALLVGAILAGDPGGARALLLHAAGHWWPAVLLWFFLGLTFGSVQIGVATMLLAVRPRRPGGGFRAPVLHPTLLRAAGRART